MRRRRKGFDMATETIITRSDLAEAATHRRQGDV
jgi:hypothetical protein